MISYVSDIRKHRIKGPLFEKIRILCTHNDVLVRKTMVDNVLRNVCANINPDMIEIYLLDKFLELIYDNDF